MKKLSLVLVFMLVFTCVAPAAFARGSYLGWLTVVNCNEWVTLRARPSTKADTVARIPLGGQVEAYYYNSEFSECYYLGLHGYVLNSYLSGSYQQYMGYMTVSHCNEWVTLRSYPSTSADTVTRIPLGATVEAYWYNDQFAECYYCGLHGHVLRAYLEY